MKNQTLFQKVLLTLSVLFCLSTAHAALELELTQGIEAALPISIVPLTDDGQGHSSVLNQVIAHDLEMSGRFKVMPSLVQKLDFPAEKPPLDGFRAAGIDNIVAGRVVSLGGGRVHVFYQLMQSVGAQTVLLNREFEVTAPQLRHLAHHISDEIYHELTGDAGVFSTRIAYIVVQRSQNNLENTQYLLEVADADGYQPQILLKSKHPIMSPSWSPDGKKIAYVSFENERAQIYQVALASGQRELLTRFPGINGAPTFSPDSQQMAIVLSKTGMPKIYLVSLAHQKIKQLTFGDAIDTEPSFSPDGKSLLFTSNRGGGPQIYKITLNTGAISRVSFNGPYNARASISKDGTTMVMLHREEGLYNIAIQDLATGALVNLTNSGHDESPSFSPNGKLVLYATHHGGNGILSIVSTDGRVRMRLPAREGDVQEPAWSPFLK